MAGSVAQGHSNLPNFAPTQWIGLQDVDSGKCPPSGATPVASFLISVGKRDCSFNSTRVGDHNWVSILFGR